MSYDRYLAICKPLHYASLMNGRFCLQLAVMSWISSLLGISITVLLMLNLTFCGPNEIDHFFCDFIPIITFFCSDTFLVEVLVAVLVAMCTFPTFLLTMTSYICIITTILKISSTSKRQKAFSTCSSHLTVVAIFYGTIFIVYVLPKQDSLRNLDKVFSFYYTVLTPLVNPLIYSLRNRVPDPHTKVIILEGIQENRREYHAEEDRCEHKALLEAICDWKVVRAFAIQKDVCHHAILEL
ncbi:olfactory receptor 488-like [Alligator sinensis]|uniref:Olfactory receptor 488-like n=1 Tax=Alligator sinensis TaxID=38654 RepID=A0A3Q0HBR3_ALLSI|nr:olfactory receptor 488-like [Alligator sinensis]